MCLQIFRIKSHLCMGVQAGAGYAGIRKSARFAPTYLSLILHPPCVCLRHPTGQTGLRPAGLYPTDGREDQNQVDQPRGECRLLHAEHLNQSYGAAIIFRKVPPENRAQLLSSNEFKPSQIESKWQSLCGSERMTLRALKTCLH